MKPSDSSIETAGSAFSPLVFLASLGAGGISVMPFVLFQYSLDHGAGLITREQLWSVAGGQMPAYFLSLEAVMVVFAALHFFLTFFFIFQLVKWLKTSEFGRLLNDPLQNASLLAPFISIAMSMNVVIGPIRYFLPAVSSSFQELMLPAFIFWSGLFAILLLFELRLLKISFERGFDVNKISFGWLLHPFALGMVTVVGTGIAAMAEDPSIANSAAMMSLVSGSMGLFLMMVKLIMIFKSHFDMKELPHHKFLPSFLIVIPNITLYAISAFRFGHFLEHQHGFEMGPYFYIVIALAFAFESWYFLFGLTFLWDYLKKHHRPNFYLTQWGLICPAVAYGVLGSFVFSIVIASPVVYALVLVMVAISIIAYFELLIKHIRCFGSKQALQAVSCG